MVRKPIIFGLVLLTVGGLLTGCSSTDGGIKGEQSPSSMSRQVTIDKFTKAVADKDSSKAQSMLSDDSYVGKPVDIVIFPKTPPKILDIENGKVKVRVISVSIERRYLDAVYALGDVNLQPDTKYGVVEGIYDGTVSSPHEAFTAQLASGKSISNDMGGDEASISINDIFFNGGTSNPEITGKTVNKIIALYKAKGFDVTANQVMSQVTIQVDGSVQISLSDDGISTPNGEVVPKTATYNSATNEWSDLR